MAGFSKNPISRLKISALRASVGVSRLDRTGSCERFLQKTFTKQLSNNNRDRLIVLAEYSERSNDPAMAIVARCELMRLLNPKAEKVRLWNARKICQLETALRTQIQNSGKPFPAMLKPSPDLPHLPVQAGKNTLDRYQLRTRHKLLQRFWAVEFPGFSEHDKGDLRKGYLRGARQLREEGHHVQAIAAYEALMAYWPDDQVAYSDYYRFVMEQVSDSGPEAIDRLDRWWALYDSKQAGFSEKTQERIWALTKNCAKRLVTSGRADDTETVINPAFKRWPENFSALSFLAQASELRGNWVLAASQWQLMAASTNPITTKTLTHVAKKPQEMLRQSKYAKAQLRNVRFELAREQHEAGNKRAFSELISRAVEMIPDQRLLKKDRSIIDGVRTYVQDALVDDGVSLTGSLQPDGKPRKVAIVLDVLKMSDVHTHSRVVFAICRNLMRLDDSIETHVIVTNERFAATTPILSSSFNSNPEEKLIAAARAALPNEYGKRFFAHYFKSVGLEGIVNTCKSIIDINPDVMLFGGGHLGLFSNESRIIRHCLYDSFPSSFFYIQANNEIDEKLDLVIARGPHEILGENGHEAVKVRIQPYPTIMEASIPVDIDPTKQDSQIIISAVAGVRMDSLMGKQSDEHLSAFFSILDRNPEVVWHFIGSSDPESLVNCSPQFAARVQSGRVVVHPVLPFDEFKQFVGQKASLFLHLPGFTGGSGGATVARRAGVPILTFQHSDVSGRQPKETIFDLDSVSDYVDMACDVLSSKIRWEETVKAQVAHTNWILETSSQGFYECLIDATTIGRTRIAKNGDPLRGKAPSLTVIETADGSKDTDSLRSA